MTQRLAEALVLATANSTTIAADDAPVPMSLAVAMGVQAATIAAIGGAVSGWKVGMTPEGVPMSAPMLAATTLASGANWALTAAGPILAEVEIAVQLKHDLPARPQQPYSRAEVEAAIGAVMIGMELIRSRLADGQTPAFPLWLADRLGTAGYVVGAATTDFARLDLAALRTRFWVDGELLHEKTGGHPQNDPVAPVLAAVNWELHPGFKKGDIITTGSLITPFRCAVPHGLTAEIDGIGKASVNIVAGR